MVVKFLFLTPRFIMGNGVGCQVRRSYARNAHARGRGIPAVRSATWPGSCAYETSLLRLRITARAESVAVWRRLLSAQSVRNGRSLPPSVADRSPGSVQM